MKPDASPDEVMQLLHHIIDHPEEYQAKKEIVDDMEMKTVEQMCEEYRSFYRELLEFTEKELPEDKIDRDFICQSLENEIPVDLVFHWRQRQHRGDEPTEKRECGTESVDRSNKRNDFL